MNSGCDRPAIESFFPFCLTQHFVGGRPPKFLPRSDLQSIACGRGSGGQSSSRYVDMVLQQQDGDVVEFTNIQREELAVLNDYIHQVLIPAMQGDVKNDNLTVKPENVMPEDEVREDEDDDDGENDDDSDDDDENFVDADVDAEEEGDEDEENDSEEDGDEDDGDFEVVDDDFAKELVKKGTRVPDAPRASRSSKRKGLHAKATDDDDGFTGEDDDDDDFEVVQEAASATESEDEYERLGSPTKRGRK